MEIAVLMMRRWLTTHVREYLNNNVYNACLRAFYIGYLFYTVCMTVVKKREDEFTFKSSLPAVTYVGDQVALVIFINETSLNYLSSALR